MTTLNRIPRRALLAPFESLCKWTCFAIGATAFAFGSVLALDVIIGAVIRVIDVAGVALLAWMGVI